MKKPLRKELENLPQEVLGEIERGLCFFAALQNRTGNKEQPATQQPAPVKEARPLNWPADKVQRYRIFLVRKMWETDLRAELVDRIVELVVNGFVTYQEVDQIIEKATQRKRRYDETNGAKGSESMWRTIGAWTKEKWIETGRSWTATNKRLEPRPPEQKSITEVMEPMIQRRDRDDDSDVEALSQEEIHQMLKQARYGGRI